MSFKAMETKGRAMTKKLVIRFVKFERALAMQILEQEGYFKATKHVKSISSPAINYWYICLRGNDLSSHNIISTLSNFSNNAERDEHLNNVIKWISEEQFADIRKLKIGEKCLFSDDGNEWHSGKFGGKCAKQLGEPRFLELDGDAWLARWKYVEPLPLHSAPKIDGDVYTWEESE